MELAIPALALGGLYLMNKDKTPEERRKTVNDIDFKQPTYTDNKWTRTKKPEKSEESEKSIDKMYTSLTGENVSSDFFGNHSNTQHFYTKTPKENYNLEQSNTILDNKMGAGTYDIKKKETAPLFKPEDNMHFPNGTPNTSAFIQSRMVNSNIRNNEKPWNEIQVAPGVGEGYNSKSNSGFNSHLYQRDQYLDRNVDELRTTNNPKLSFRGGEGPSKFYNNSRGVQAPVNKNRPDRHFEQGSDRYLVTAADHKKNRVRAEQILPETERLTTTRDYYGGARKVESKAGYVDGVYRDPKKEHLGSYPVSNPANMGAYVSNDNDYGVNGYNALTNNRSLNKEREKTFLGAAASLVGAVTAPFIELLHPTKKENLIDNVKNPGNVRSEVSQTYYFNPGDRPKITKKETTVDNPYLMNVGSQNTERGGYHVTQHQEAPTMRGMQLREYSGIAGGGGINAEISTLAEQNAIINTNKEGTLTGRTSGGNTNIFNSAKHIQIDKLDQDRNNNRMYVPQNVGKMQPNKFTIGENSNMNNDDIALDRTNPDILTNLNTNPYAVYFK